MLRYPIDFNAIAGSNILKRDQDNDRFFAVIRLI